MKKRLQDLVNRLSYIKPPPPPIKMNVDEYIELLNRIKNSEPDLQEEALKVLDQYQVDLEILAEKLSRKIEEDIQYEKTFKQYQITFFFLFLCGCLNLIYKNGNKTYSLYCF